ncbi:MAG: glycosyltransferase [Ginsengibacter sp.]|jgi:cellulose synthase/poly-beta-1,6-N-acetylglucosamine synthase-like glycosyltransferase
MMVSILTFSFLILYAALIFFYKISWHQIPVYNNGKSVDKTESLFISIIIPARNEEKDIGLCIQSIISQTLPSNNFEIIVVNDHSTDNTTNVVLSFKQKNIHLINLEDFTKDQILNSYKKKSIETAMRFAKGELIVTTDADCLAPQKWLETLAAFYEDKSPVFVALPVVFKNALNSDSFLKRFFKNFQSLDFMMLQGITGASVYKKFHAMCNGANLAYEKKVFYQVNGFEGIDKLASGDDMLLMHKIQKHCPEKIMFLKSQNVIVETTPAETFKGFINQRIRWASKADQYTDKKITTVLLLVYFLNVWIFILGISSFFSMKAFYLFLISIAIKTIVEFLFLHPVAKFFGRQKLLWWFLPAQLFHILYTILAGFLGKFGSYEWKERRVK